MNGLRSYAIEQYADFLHELHGGYNHVVASVLGLLNDRFADHYAFSTTNPSVPCGFTTKPFYMMQYTAGDCAVAAELIMDGVMRPYASLERVEFSDGANSIAVYNEGSGMEDDTLYTATIGGEVTSGTIVAGFNIGGTRGISGSSVTEPDWMRYNMRYRFDKRRKEFSVWMNDQLLGKAEFEDLGMFERCAFTYKHSGFLVVARPVYVKRIGLRVEY